MSGAPNEFGAQVVLSCSPGHYLEGARLLRCQADGTWSAGEQRPRCRGESQACSGPPRPLSHDPRGLDPTEQGENPFPATAVWIFTASSGHTASPA